MPCEKLGFDMELKTVSHEQTKDPTKPTHPPLSQRFHQFSIIQILLIIQLTPIDKVLCDSQNLIN